MTHRTSDTAPDTAAASLLETDPPRHTRLRSLVSSFFAGRRIPSFEPLIAAEVDALLDGPLPRPRPLRAPR
ncbi:hypothetical protein [Streptomyces sp. NPDC050548]|uniref:hypothetical protein n=1 Tax=Streptomyces sp. NPDC050548 TaxID=3365629 RepID=UPI0037920383